MNTYNFNSNLLPQMEECITVGQDSLVVADEIKQLEKER
jgi:hypothetical protein